MNSPASLDGIDQKISSAWDAELILREQERAALCAVPRTVGRRCRVVTAAGGALTSKFSVPVAIFRTEPDE